MNHEGDTQYAILAGGTEIEKTDYGKLVGLSPINKSLARVPSPSSKPKDFLDNLKLILKNNYICIDYSSLLSKGICETEDDQRDFDSFEEIIHGLTMNTKGG